MYNVLCFLRNNVARLDVYFEQLNYENIKEEPAYTVKLKDSRYQINYTYEIDITW